MFLAFGVGGWFAQPVEPGAPAYVATCAALLGALGLWRWGPEIAQPLVIAVACVLAGGLAGSTLGIGVFSRLSAAGQVDLLAGHAKGDVLGDRAIRQVDALRHMGNCRPPGRQPLRICRIMQIRPIHQHPPPST
jgi:hypothetical protein